MNKIFEIEDLKELENYLSKQNASEINEKLFAEFLRYADYKNASEWNKAARLCECLAIVGWGKHEPLQAVCGKFYNGNPKTSFYNKFNQARFVSAIWSKRKNGYTMENGRTFYAQSPDLPNKPTDQNYPVKECIEDIKLADQRNWIPRNPIYITRSLANCYENSKSVIESIKNDLQTNLDLRMTPEKYGKAVDFIKISLSFSYGPFTTEWGVYCNVMCNYVIFDKKPDLKRKDLYPIQVKMRSEGKIGENDWLCNRYEYGSFRRGVFNVHIYFEKELGEMSFVEQKQKIALHIEDALHVVVEKLKTKKLDYNFDLMQSDFLTILNEWKKI
jgi:hypothetical protein